MAKSIRALKALLTVCLIGLVLSGCASVKDTLHKVTAPATQAAMPAAPAPRVVPAVQPAAPAVASPISTPVVSASPLVKQAVDTPSARTERVVASEFRSLQPFRHFGKGTGEGYALSYEPRSKAQFVALLRSGKGLRVSCHVLVRQMAEVHGLPFEGCEGATKEILSNQDYTVVACTKAVMAKNWLAVTDAGGKTFGVWQRECLAGEQILTYKGQPIASTMCANAMVPLEKVVAPAPQPAPQPVAAALAPQVFVPASCAVRSFVRVNVWTPDAVNQPGVRASVKAEAERPDDYYNVEGVSRKHGGLLREKATASAEQHVATLNLVKADGQTFLIHQGPVVAKQLFPLPADFADGDIIQLVFQDQAKVVSPNRDLRAKWSEFRWCITNVHAIER